MHTDSPSLTPHCQKVLALLASASKPLTAYEMLDQLRDAGIKAPPTVYRALETLLKHGLVHRLESLGAFIACHGHAKGEHHTQFTVCRICGKVEEIHDPALARLLTQLATARQFTVEREMLELVGLCHSCSATAQKEAH